MIFHLKRFSTKSKIFVEIYFMIWRNERFGFLIVPISILKSCIRCINMCNVLKHFKTMVYDDFMM